VKLRALVVVVACTLLSACGGGAKMTAEPAPLTQTQAERLSQAGYTNYLAKGAEFEANSAFLGPGGNQSLTLSGQIDWERHTGRAFVRGDGREAGITEVYWEETFILERRPAMDAIVSGLGGPSAPWIARRPDPATRQLDRLIGLIVGLASEQPDNALLVQQKEGSEFMRNDTLRDTSVEVLRYGNRNIYWLDAANGSMLRFEGNSAAGNAPVVIDILERKAVDAPRPVESDVVPVDQVAEAYAAITGG